MLLQRCVYRTVAQQRARYSPRTLLATSLLLLHTVTAYATRSSVACVQAIAVSLPPQLLLSATTPQYSHMLQWLYLSVELIVGFNGHCYSSWLHFTNDYNTRCLVAASNGTIYSLCSLGANSIENTASNSSSIVACISVSVGTWCGPHRTHWITHCHRAAHQLWIFLLAPHLLLSANTPQCHLFYTCTMIHIFSTSVKCWNCTWNSFNAI
jgi:hypothetical protein